MFYKKEKISNSFRNTESSTKFSTVLEFKGLLFELNTDLHSLDEYIKLTYDEFVYSKNTKSSNYVFNFFQTKKKLILDKIEDEVFYYNYIQFFNTFFFYRFSKKDKILDIWLPNRYEFWEFENFFKLFISSISLNYNSILLHASAIIKDDKVVLFSGQSGAGKSTIASLSNYEIIHDDNILITHVKGSFFEFETIPFKTPYNKVKFKGEIEGFYRLFQNDSNIVKEIDINKQMTHLLFGIWSFDSFPKEDTKTYNENMMDYCAKILPYLNVKELYFTKTNDFLQLL